MGSGVGLGKALRETEADKEAHALLLGDLNAEGVGDGHCDEVREAAAETEGNATEAETLPVGEALGRELRLPGGERETEGLMLFNPLALVLPVLLCEGGATVDETEREPAANDNEGRGERDTEGDALGMELVLAESVSPRDGVRALLALTLRHALPVTGAMLRVTLPVCEGHPDAEGQGVEESEESGERVARALLQKDPELLAVMAPTLCEAGPLAEAGADAEGLTLRVNEGLLVALQLAHCEEEADREPPCIEGVKRLVAVTARAVCEPRPLALMLAVAAATDGETLGEAVPL